MSVIRVHLVRHGEVLNPEHIVYADLPGFGLSNLGRAQATTAAHYLTSRHVGVIVASPLQRALETAEIIGTQLALDVQTDARLTEWHLASRWAAIRWSDLPAVRPGELEAYLDHPDNLDFTPETLTELAQRMREAIEEASAMTIGDLVVVSHQDPIHAVERHLSGSGFDNFVLDKPGHGAVVTLEYRYSEWCLVSKWEPNQTKASLPKD